MDSRHRIRDTSAQDHALATPGAPRRVRRAWVVGGIAGLALLAGVAWVVQGWAGGGRSFDATRLRIAEVTRGDLVRDLSADGRVIAANNPTLYAIAAGTVTLKVVAGDAVKKGQALAVIDSPELRSKLVQEESTLASMEAEANRAVLDAQLARSTARKLLDQAQIDRTAAERDLQRYQRGFDGGAVPQVDLSKAQDDLKKADLGLASARKDYGLQGEGAALDSRNKRLLAERQLLGKGRRLEGHDFDALLADAPDPLRDAFARGGDGMFSIGDDDNEDIYYLSRRLFRLNGRRHELILLRLLTAELRRQEVQTWKKVIRVISHELNNSLAPIASLAHSSAELLRRGQHERLPVALATIEERTRHLEGFIRDYARFAKLPSPRLDTVEWPRFLDQLRTQVEFGYDGPSDGIARFDVAQLEQALLNLLKNAHESGSAAQDVRLALRRLPDGWRIDVLDRGSGMNDAVLANALLPFYSTKRNGTGLGLALVREIAEAHGGRIALGNRDGGGLSVSVVLPG